MILQDIKPQEMFLHNENISYITAFITHQDVHTNKKQNTNCVTFGPQANYTD
jgi:hypothetical protein